MQDMQILRDMGLGDIRWTCKQCIHGCLKHISDLTARTA